MNRRVSAAVVLTCLAGGSAACGDGEMGPQGAMVIVLDVKGTTPDLIESSVRPVVEQAASDGVRFSVRLSNSSSASGDATVAFGPEASGGDFLPTAGNSSARRLDAEEWAEAAMADIEAAVANEPSRDAGQDLIGSIEAAARSAGGGLDSGATAEVVLVSSGVVVGQQFSMLEPPLGEAEAVAAARNQMPSIAPGVGVRIIGAGEFAGIDQVVSSDFANGVRAFWDEICKQLDERGTRCELS